MYIKTLKSQWENLCSDFYQNFDIISPNGNNTAEYNKWYSVKIHRWNSSAYSEGIILEQQNNPQLSSAILESLKNFNFRHVDNPKAKSSWPGLITSAAVGVGTAWAASSFLDWSFLAVVPTGVAVSAVCAVPILKFSSDSVRDINEKIKQEYLSQLKDYWSELESACRKFEAS